jgi:hypothetical protein
MRERPIPFSAPMVRALLAGTKTQTRRAVKPQPPPECSIHYMLGNESWLPPEKRAPLHHHWEAWGGPLFESRPPKALAGSFSVNSPYGQPGDRLWVREAWRAVDLVDDCAPRELDPGCRVWYEANAPHQPGFGRFRQGMFMPRWASRITLEVTDVRVERLQDISEADAIAEGITCENVIVDTHCAGGVHTEVHGDRYFFDGGHDEGYEEAVDAYRALWESINGEGSWDSNPWVWVVEFKQITPQGGNHA